jgi:hypothetical protein
MQVPGFEMDNHDDDNNRTNWAPLNLARYLIEKKEAIDSAWRRITPIA